MHGIALQELFSPEAHVCVIISSQFMKVDVGVKGTVSQYGTGYKSGINQKVSLNPIDSEAKKVIL